MREDRLKAFDVDPASIILFCSIGNHFSAAVRDLKKRFPRASLTAAAPPWRTGPLSGEDLIDKAIEVTRDKLHPIKNLGECVRVLAAIRAERCDLFVTMYDSAALNVLHSLSGSRLHAVFDVRGDLHAIRVSRLYPVELVLCGVGRTLLGWLTYALIGTTLCVWSFRRRRD